MKFCVAAAVLLCSLFALSTALPAQKRMVYYQARASPQRVMMFQRIVQQPAASKTHARSAAYVAENSGSYLKEDVAGVENQAAEESVLKGAEPYPAAGGQVSAEFEGTFADGGVDVAVSGAADVPAADFPAFAEAPEVPELPQVSDDVPEAPVVDNQVLEDIPEVAPVAENLPSDDASKVPREYNFENPAEAVPEPAVASVQIPVAEDAIPEIPAVPQVPELPAVPSVIAEQAPEVPEPAIASAQVPVVAAAVPAVPAVVSVVKPIAVSPPISYLPPRKKIIVKLDEQAEVADDDDEADADSYRPARVPNARRPAKGSGSAVAPKGTKAQLPVGTFFPINFGGTSGGAIAIANSFSTGEGGSATSHAIAYGSPDAARSKARPVRRH